MKAQGLVSINDIVAATGLSRATVDRVINKRPGVHPRTQAHVLRVISRLENGELLPGPEVPPAEGQTAYQLCLIIQASQAFTQQLLDAVRRVNEAQSSGVAGLQALASRSDEETLELVRALGVQADGVALVAKNAEPLKAALAALRTAGKPVVALVSDLDTAARSAYVGIDNRAAGRLAAFLCGRCLERLAQAQVALVVGYAAYRCHEDREIGFRALLRQRFPHLELVEAVKGQDSAEATYQAALELLKKWPALAGIYNLAGGNAGLAQALAERPPGRRPLVVGHELHAVTEPLLRAGVIDFLITQDLEALVRTARQRLLELKLGRGPVRELNHLPFQVVSEFNLVDSKPA
ncbi:MAG: LacI family DNA-binding transcriptional regulator [Verrucomicrobia bacterium]|nr:LacI family DNA-binding transcriptional regulator [Verrucomicrobiota bacterium]